MILQVTPEEYQTLLDLADQSTRTIDGTTDEEIWLDGIRALFGEPTTTLLLGQDVNVVVLWPERKRRALGE